MDKNLSSNSTNPLPINQNELQKTKSSRRLGIVLIAVIAVVVLIVLGFGGYYLYSTQKGNIQVTNREGVTPEGEDEEKQCIDANGKPCPQFSKNVDCENKNFKMAFILVAQNASDATPVRLSKLSWIKNEFSKAFGLATRSLASMDTAGDIAVISPQGNDENQRYYDIYKKFYETHDDIYDFISIYYVPPLSFNNFSGQLHGHVVQNIKGVGLGLWDNSADYSSQGKLKGVNIMGSIDMYSRGEGAINGLLHETGHQWCCSVGDNFARGEGGAKLEIIWQSAHFYAGLHTPNEEGDALNAIHWVPNNDGTYRGGGKPAAPGENQEAKPPSQPILMLPTLGRFMSNNIRQYEAIDKDSTNQLEVAYYETEANSRYHPFVLYFMELLPKDEYDTKFQIYDVGGIDGMWNLERALPYKQVSVRDIIEVEGERECVK